MLKNLPSLKLLGFINIRLIVWMRVVRCATTRLTQSCSSDNLICYRTFSEIYDFNNLAFATNTIAKYLALSQISFWGWWFDSPQVTAMPSLVFEYGYIFFRLSLLSVAIPAIVVCYCSGAEIVTGINLTTTTNAAPAGLNILTRGNSTGAVEAGDYLWFKVRCGHHFAHLVCIFLYALAIRLDRALPAYTFFGIRTGKCHFYFFCLLHLFLPPKLFHNAASLLMVKKTNIHSHRDRIYGLFREDTSPFGLQSAVSRLNKGILEN